jgi:hypothetical protein
MLIRYSRIAGAVDPRGAAASLRITEKTIRAIKQPTACARKGARTQECTGLRVQAAVQARFASQRPRLHRRLSRVQPHSAAKPREGARSRDCTGLRVQAAVQPVRGLPCLVIHACSSIGQTGASDLPISSTNRSVCLSVCPTCLSVCLSICLSNYSRAAHLAIVYEDANARTHVQICTHAGTRARAHARTNIHAPARARAHARSPTVLSGAPRDGLRAHARTHARTQARIYTRARTLSLPQS